MNKMEQGLYPKFNVTRADGRDGNGDKHHGCDYFVLDLTHDTHALPAIAAYAESCKDTYPVLSEDLRGKVAAVLAAANVFVTVPETTLPDGTIVPSFQVGKYLASEGMLKTPMVTASGKPWVNISYHKTREACAKAGMRLITERQWLAIACDIVNQDINWTGGAVGSGKVFQGLHKGTVASAQPATFESKEPAERRWHQLSNGEIIIDFAGNAFSWVFDDVQGNVDGLLARPVTADSISRTAAIAAGADQWREKGLGWQPTGEMGYAGRALFRGGCFVSEDHAGVFRLYRGSPDSRRNRVGFRCTK